MYSSPQPRKRGKPGRDAKSAVPGYSHGVRRAGTVADRGETVRASKARTLAKRNEKSSSCSSRGEDRAKRCRTRDRGYRAPLFYVRMGRRFSHKKQARQRPKNGRESRRFNTRTAGVGNVRGPREKDDARNHIFLHIKTLDVRTPRTHRSHSEEHAIT